MGELYIRFNDIMKNHYSKDPNLEIDLIRPNNARKTA